MYHKFNDTCIFNLKNVNYWVTPEYNNNTLKQKYILMSHAKLLPLHHRY